MRFKVSSSGVIKAIRFYKSRGETGVHTGKIYSASGTLLASVRFSGETASGWQSQALATPLNVAINTVYVVSVNTGNQYYVATNGGLASGLTNGQISAIAGPNNGVYGPVGSMPTRSYQSSNYFRDVVFTAGNSPAPSPSPAPISEPVPAPAPAPAPTSSVTPSGFPNATNTGYRNAPGYPGQLTAYTGGAIQSNKTYRFIDFNGSVDVGLPNSPVENVTFYGCRFHGAKDVLVRVFGDNINFDYSSFEPMVSAPPVSNDKGYQFAIQSHGAWGTFVKQMTVTHSDIWGFSNAIDTSGSTQAKPQVFRHNWIHDARDDMNGLDHTDGIGSPGSGTGSYIVIDHNTIASRGNTNAIAFQAGTFSNITVTNNYFSGFGYTIHLQDGDGPNFIFTGNVFGTDFRPDWGPLYGWSGGNGNVWKCNRIRFVPGTNWTSGGGWKPISSDDGKFWVPASNPASATDYKGNTSCP
jgi:hypothetical protein